MTVRLAADGTVLLEDDCPLEDAEKLQQYLIADPQARVDWRACTRAHTAVIQMLLAATPVLRGPPAGEFLRIHVAPLLEEQKPSGRDETTG